MLRARLECAHALGISLKRFDGWEPRTYYEYDSWGTLASTIQESEWDGSEQGWMLALRLYHESLCTQCGGDLDETTDPETEDGYETVPPIQCNRCVQLGRARDAYKDEPNNQSLMHRVRLRRGVRVRGRT